MSTSASLGFTCTYQYGARVLRVIEGARALPSLGGHARVKYEHTSACMNIRTRRRTHRIIVCERKTKCTFNKCTFKMSTRVSTCIIKTCTTITDHRHCAPSDIIDIDSSAVRAPADVDPFLSLQRDEIRKLALSSQRLTPHNERAAVHRLIQAAAARL